MGRNFSVKVNFIRAIGACWIFVFHFYHFYSHQYFASFDSINPLLLLVYHGYWAVYLFYLLSGFLLARIYLGKRLVMQQFFGKRLLRLFPAYYLCLFAYFVCINTPNDGSLWMAWWSDGSAYPQPIAHLWFINRLLICYLLFPLIWVIHRIAGNRGIAFFLCLGVLMSLLVGINDEVSPANYYGSQLLCLNQFVLGCLLASCWTNEPQGTKSLHSLLIITLWMLMLIAYHQLIWREPLSYSSIGLFWLNVVGLFIAFLLVDVLNTPIKSTGLISYFINYFGKISYSFYLFHFLVIHLFLAHPTWLDVNFWIKGPSLFLISLIVAVISYHTAERCGQLLIRRFLYRPGSAVSN